MPSCAAYVRFFKEGVQIKIFSAYANGRQFPAEEGMQVSAAIVYETELFYAHGPTVDAELPCNYLKFGPTKTRKSEFLNATIANMSFS